MSVCSMIRAEKTYPGNITALCGVDLSAERAGTIVLSGSSGSGKSTLLRLITGTERPTGGEVNVSSRSVLVPGELPPRMILRKAMIRFLKKHGVSGKEEISRRIAEYAQPLALTELLDRKAGTLPAGRLRLAAFACALAAEPELLAADEPFCGLSSGDRELLTSVLRTARTEKGVSLVLAIADPRDALSCGGRICLMREGRIVSEGSAERITLRPENAFEARFSGMALLPVTLRPSEGKMYAASGEDMLRIPDLTVRRFLSDAFIGKTVLLGVRPEDVTVRTDAEGGGFRALAEDVVVTGRGALWMLRTAGTALTLPGVVLSAAAGESVRLLPDEGRLFFFDRETGAALLRQEEHA